MRCPRTQIPGIPGGQGAGAPPIWCLGIRTSRGLVWGASEASRRPGKGESHDADEVSQLVPGFADLGGARQDILAGGKPRGGFMRD
jgi:hypothetical protein